MKRPGDCPNCDSLRHKYAKAKVRLERVAAENIEKTMEVSKLEAQLKKLEAKRQFPVSFGSFRSETVLGETEQQLAALTSQNQHLQIKLNDCAFSLKTLVSKLEAKMRREAELEELVEDLRSQLPAHSHKRCSSLFDIAAGDTVKSLGAGRFRMLATNKENLAPNEPCATPPEPKIKSLMVKTNDLTIFKKGHRSPSNGSTQTALASSTSRRNSPPTSKNRQEASAQPTTSGTISKEEFLELTDFYDNVIKELNSKLASLEGEIARKDKDHVESLIELKKLRLENASFRSKVLSRDTAKTSVLKDSQQSDQSAKFQQPSIEAVPSQPEAKPHASPTVGASLQQQQNADREAFLELMRQNQETHMAEIKLMMDTIQMLEDKLDQTTSSLVKSQRDLEVFRTEVEKEKARSVTTQQNLKQSDASSSANESILGVCCDRSQMVLSESVVLPSDNPTSDGTLLQQTLAATEAKWKGALEEKEKVEKEMQMRDSKYKNLLSTFQEISQDLKKAQKAEQTALAEVDDWKAKFTQMQYRFGGLSRDYMALKERLEIPSAEKNEAASQTEPCCSPPFPSDRLTESVTLPAPGSQQPTGQDLREELGQLRVALEAERQLASDLHDELTSFSFREFTLKEELAEKEASLKRTLALVAFYKAEMGKLEVKSRV